MPTRIVTHSKRVASIAARYGWYSGALYTNLRDIREENCVGLIDVRWKEYNYKAHLSAVKKIRPLLTVAQDITDVRYFDDILIQASELAYYAKQVIIVPKDPKLQDIMNTIIPEHFLLGFSVPTRYGQSPIEPKFFRRPVHLLGGRPDVQRKLANIMHVVSFDCNRFTLDAAFGDYFDGETFRPHPSGGYLRCIEDSILNINKLWEGYEILKM